jgi:hypothetical protein
MVIWQFPLQVAELDEVLSSNALYEKMSAVLDGQHITSFCDFDRDFSGGRALGLGVRFWH